ncbi:hypothetical protein [Magnetospirillum sulfuroxidans]|uniref:Peptidase C1 n=1 Tax=Magnetospirillum sulfuroxidans TaxID=611300 RepID=A0ABS5IH74_9PROT|nr:hypothetical protein [Magnetospirillum sulfuroxidans]MBR9973780.1 hypothetical protein [Magnetospirillum sulfuroxidans]
MHIVSDLRDRFGIIRDQGQRPTCLAMSASDVHGSHQGAINLSAEYLFYQGVRLMTPPDPHAGLTTGVVSTVLGSDGQPLEADWPYQTTQPDPWSPPGGLGRMWISEMEFRKAAADEAAHIIGSGKPLVLGLALSTAFFTPDTAGRLRFQQGDLDTPHRHAVVGVAAAYSTEGDMNVLVRNSWGDGWGLNGHAWLPVGYLEKRLLWIGSIGGDAANEAH